MVDAFNHDCLSMVPQKGTLGASGDLAPLAHLALGLIGEGKMLDIATGKFLPASDVLQKAGLTPVELTAKEGLAMINGTQMITALGCEAVARARRLLPQADVSTIAVCTSD
jgi:histidine ammonia-lyase